MSHEIFVYTFTYNNDPKPTLDGLLPIQLHENDNPGPGGDHLDNDDDEEQVED